MAVKTFTNEQLTASDTNTYLANAGLVYITSTTVGSAVSSVTVSNCFSSTYDHYRIIWGGGTCSNSGVSTYIKFGSAATAYYGSQVYWTCAIDSWIPADGSPVTWAETSTTVGSPESSIVPCTAVIEGGAARAGVLSP